MNARKKIAVNTRFLIRDKLEGIGLFTSETLCRIARAHPEIDFYFLFDRKYDPAFIFSDNVKPVVLFPPARHPFLWYWWFEVSVARWLHLHQPDLFLSTDGFACMNTSTRQVIVVHDLAFEHFDDHVPWLVQKFYKHYVPLYAKKAHRIATVSEFSKNDLCSLYGIPAGKVDVACNGAKEIYNPVSEAIKQDVRRKYTGGKEFFIYVGAVHPRKNVTNLLMAFEQFKRHSGSDSCLVIAGRKSWGTGELETRFDQMKHKSDVHFIGHTAPEELGKITASALAMVYVSFFEGFGIPIVEAMRCEVPVITSNVSSMPEVAGDAALLVDPRSVEEIALAMSRIESDTQLRNTLVEKGRWQVQKFTWDKAADKLWQCCAKVLI